MSIIISGLNFPMEASHTSVFESVMHKFNITREEIQKIAIAKVSIDARHKSNIALVYSVEVRLNDNKKEDKLVENNGNIRKKATSDRVINFGSEKLETRPVIIGFGPSGMFAALLLAQHGYCPVVYERGDSVENRVGAVNKFWTSGDLNKNTNVQFGEGGAGTFSDGKLTTRISDPLCTFVLEELVKFSAPEEILTKSKPHIGTDNLRDIVKNIREEIISLGGEVNFLSCVEDIDIKNGKVNSITVNGEKKAAQNVILAIGHSARDTFDMLMGKDLDIIAKPFSVGVRIEHLQSDINKALYGPLSKHPMLQKGEYQLSHRMQSKDKAVYTFCMCPGGIVVPATSQEGTVVVNGMSEFSRDQANANSGIVVSVGEKDFGTNPKDAIAYQLKLEQLAFAKGGSNYKAPAQDVKSFMNGKKGLNIGEVHPSYSLGVEKADFNEIFSKDITDMLKIGINQFSRKIHGFGNDDAILTGVETRTSSPIRIVRNENLQSAKAQGLYPCGEGVGYAGGIISAAVDGLKIATHIMEQYKSIQ